MTNITINSLPTYPGSVDRSADILPIYDNSTAGTVGVSVNNLLNLTSAPVGINDSQTLTNKVLTNPTINAATLSGTLSGTYTLGGTPTFPSSVVTLTGSQTLTNKILTSPTINSPTITNATISADTITGYSVATNVTAGGVTLQNGAVGGTTGTFSGLLTASNGLTVSSGTVTLPAHSINAATMQLTNQRQGGTTGTATWATAGTSNTSLTGTTTFIQVGSVSSGAGGAVTITFPTAFTQIPLIFCTVQAATNGFWAQADPGTSSTTQALLSCWSATGALATNKTIFWLAIGQ